MNIYVGNLNYNTTEEELKELFGQFGAVESVKVITDRFSGQSKGFGFVEMANDSEASEAISSLNSSDFMGRTIKVNTARERR